MKRISQLLFPLLLALACFTIVCDALSDTVIVALRRKYLGLICDEPYCKNFGGFVVDNFEMSMTEPHHPRITFSFTKIMDGVSAKLSELMMNTEQFSATIQVSAESAQTKSKTPIMTFTLDNAIMTQYSMAGNMNDPKETEKFEIVAEIVKYEAPGGADGAYYGGYY